MDTLHSQPEVIPAHGQGRESLGTALLSAPGGD